MTPSELKEKAYNEGIEKINSIYEVFKDYYDESRVDLQNIVDIDTFKSHYRVTENDIIADDSNYIPFIIVHFPEVTVTNEFDDSVLIKDLWAKVKVTFKGTIVSGFSLNRSTYTKAQWDSDYMHSHISGIPKHNIENFLSPCLGTGPIKDTISSLSIVNDLALWSLFCRELDVYTKTESISGVPYRRMSNIGTHNVNGIILINDWFYNITFSYNIVSNDFWKDFITYLLNKDILKFNYINNTYGIAMSGYEYYITISNVFIEWYNDKFNKKEYSMSMGDLIDKKIIIPVHIINRKMYNIANSLSVIRNVENKKVLSFKGRDILLHIDMGENSNTLNIYHILNLDIATGILRTLLTIVNHKYGRETNNNSSTSERYLV